MAGPDALVIGGGVSGLTTAVCLTEAGLRVAVRSATDPAASTSAVAGAMWLPVGSSSGVRWPAWTRRWRPPRWW